MILEIRPNIDVPIVNPERVARHRNIVFPHWASANSTLTDILEMYGLHVDCTPEMVKEGILS